MSLPVLRTRSAITTDVRTAPLPSTSHRLPQEPWDWMLGLLRSETAGARTWDEVEKIRSGELPGVTLRSALAADVVRHRRGLSALGAGASSMTSLWLLAPTHWAQLVTLGLLVGAPLVVEVRAILRLPDDCDRYARLYRGWEVGNAKGGKP